MTATEVSPATVAAAPEQHVTWWRRWRKSRPFWGGLLTILAGIEITMIPIGAYKIIFVSPSLTIAIVSGLVVVILGLAVWMTPQHSRLYGMFIILAAIVSFVMSNLGGFFVGGVLGIIGGALVFAWDPPLTVAAPRHAGEPAAANVAVATSEETRDVPLDDLMGGDLRDAHDATVPHDDGQPPAADGVDPSSEASEHAEQNEPGQS